MLDLALTTLLSPVVLFFILGLLAALYCFIYVTFVKQPEIDLSSILGTSVYEGT